MAAEKVDLKKTLDGFRATVGEFRVLDVPPTAYFMVDGHGDPNRDPAFGAAIAALYPAAYKLKFASKRELGRDYVVPPLEGLWYSDDLSVFTSARDKAAWSWTLMLMIPAWIEPPLVEAALAAAGVADRVRAETLAEGRCVQTLHVGSFDDEAEVLARMHDEFIPDAGLALTGRHHEIYLSDFRRVEPARLRTILRQPVVARAETA